MNANSKTSSHKNNPPHLRRSVLATASVMALGGFLGGGALAQTANYNVVTVPPTVSADLNLSIGVVTYNDWIGNSQLNTGAVTSQVTTTTVKAEHLTLPGGATPSAPVTFTNTDSNSLTATAGGNTVGNTIDLWNLDNGVPRAGLIVLSGQANTQAIQSEVLNSSVFVSEALQISAPISVSSNTLAAGSTINNADNLIIGAVPAVAPSSTTQGLISTNMGAATNNNNAAGSAIVNNNQLATTSAGGSYSKATNATVSLDLAQTTNAGAAITDPVVAAVPGLLSKALTVDGNTIAATYSANDATNAFIAENDVTSPAVRSSVAFEGSVVVSNAQLNLEQNLTSTGLTASITGSSVTADVRNQAASPGRTDLTGALSVSSNSLTAASSGNTALTTGGVPGNSILFRSGENLTGTTSATSNVLAFNAGAETTTVGADLALSNAQVNRNAGLNSQVKNGVVTITADQLTSTGTIAANSNTVEVSSLGNQASSLIGVLAANLNATAAAGNLQTNNATPITAANTAPAVQVGVGFAGQNVAGTVTVNSNSLTANVDGNIAATDVLLGATNINSLSTAAAASVSAQGAAATTTSAQSGASATNLQGNYGANSPLSATVTDAKVEANFVQQSGAGAGTRVNLVGAVATLNNNTIQASAAGNTAGTSVTLNGGLLAGNTVNAQAGVGNAQFHETPVTATVSGSTGVIALAGDLSGASYVTVNDNTVDASIRVNNAANSVGVTGAVLTAGPAPFGAGNNVSVSGTAATSNAAFAVASSQVNTATQAASNTTLTSFAAANLGAVADVAIANPVTVNGNNATASTVGNTVDNAVSLVIGNDITTANGAPARVAGLANFQTNQVTGAASAEVGFDFASTYPAPLIGIAVGPGKSIVNSPLTVNDNTLSATAYGNTAGNDMTVKAATYIPAGTGGTGVISGTAIDSGFALLNVQTDAVSGGRSATSRSDNGVYGGIGLPLTAVTSSSITVNGNESLAEARNNNATNDQSLVFGNTLNGSAGLLNQQSSTTAVNAGAFNYIRVLAIDVPATTNSTLSVSGNTNQAMAVGSFAESSQTVEAPNVYGNAAITAGTGANSGVAMTADYGLANNQSQTTGQVRAIANSAIGVDMGGAFTTAGFVNTDATVQDNENNAYAQATSATNTQVLKATVLGGVSGALGSTQTTNANVLSQSGLSNASNLVSASRATTGSSVSVERNTVRAVSGQNEAFNTQNVTGSNTLNGAGQGNNTSSAAAGPVATANTDFSLVNLQSGTGVSIAPSTTDNPTTSAGGVVAYAQDIRIGSDIAVYNASTLTVSNNDVFASAIFNRAGNAQTLTGGNIAATAAVANSQISSGAGADAVIKSVEVGTMHYDATDPGHVWHGLAELVSSTATVEGNTLRATADGNVASNAQKVTGTTVAGSAGAPLTNNPTFAVQNYQGNAATVNSTVSNIREGVFLEYNKGLADQEGVITDSKVTVSGNNLNAISNGNTSANTLDVAASNSAGDATSGVTALVNNVQRNTAESVKGTVGGPLATDAIDLGIRVVQTGNAQGISGSTLSVESNTLDAQARGNTTTNGLTVAVKGPMAGSTANPALYVNSDQSNTAALTGNVQNVALGISAATIATTSSTVSGNNLFATTNANDATNYLTVAATELGDSTNGVNTKVKNLQDNTGIASAQVKTANVGIAASVSITGPSAVVTGNKLIAQTDGNTGDNTLSVTATNIYGGGQGARNDVVNNQTNSGTLSGLVQAATVTVDAPIISGTTVTVSGNELEAFTRANDARNVLTVGASSGMTGVSSGVSNTQGNTAGVTADVLTTKVGAYAATSIAGPAVTVSDNKLIAKTDGNTGDNTLSVKATTIAGPASNNVGNTQTNGGALAGTVAGATVQINAPTVTTVATVNNNDLWSLNRANLANNAVTVSATTMGPNVTSLVDNNQGNTGSVTGTVSGSRVGISAATTFTGAAASVTDNALLATADGNAAENTLKISAGNTLNGSTAVPTNRVTNLQNNAGVLAAKVSDSQVGLSSAAIAGTAVTVSGNTFETEATANWAKNRATVESSNVAGGLGSDVTNKTDSTQTNTAGVSATTEKTRVGVPADPAITVNTIATSPTAVSGNELTASATGNSVDSAMTVSSLNTLGGSASVPTNQVTNLQTNSGVGITALVGGTLAADGSMVGVAAGSITGSPTTVNSSLLSAQSMGNEAANALTVKSSNVMQADATALVDNRQTNSAISTARVLNSVVGINTTGAISGSAATVGGGGLTGNNLVAQGDGNVGRNTLTVHSDNTLAGSVTGAPTEKVISNQTNAATGAITARVDTAQVGVFSGSTIGTSDVTVAGNNLQAFARANTVENALSATAVSITAGTGAPTFLLDNTQNNQASTTAEVLNTVVGVRATTALNGPTATVSENGLTAVAGGNKATNALNVEATTRIAPNTTTAPGVVLVNRQNNDGAGVVNASVVTGTIGALNTGAFNGVNTSVISNYVVSYGYGNTASNSLVLSSLAGNTSQAAASITNTQFSAQNVNALISGVTIGIGNGGIGGGSSIVSSNSIAAQAMGNAAVNGISSK